LSACKTHPSYALNTEIYRLIDFLAAGRGLPSQTLSLVSHGSPVIGRLAQHSLGFGVSGLVRQLVAINGLGTKYFCFIHGITIPTWGQCRGSRISFKKEKSRYGSVLADLLIGAPFSSLPRCFFNIVAPGGWKTSR
jgi:hypothetical protein